MSFLFSQYVSCFQAGLKSLLLFDLKNQIIAGFSISSIYLAVHKNSEPQLPNIFTEQGMVKYDSAALITTHFSLGIMILFLSLRSSFFAIISQQD